MQTTLGPVLYFWSRQDVFDFYEKVSRSDIDRVCLGEVTCSKRRELSHGDWMAIARMLTDAGKKVILSTLTLLESESELSQVRKICDNHEFMVEANDMSAVKFLSSNGLEFCTGPSLNIYNAYTLKQLYKLGLKRWVLPLELSEQKLADILMQAEALKLADKIETEVFSYGYMPLAYSARCFTARANDRGKDECEFICLKVPQGIPLATQENQRLFTLNGIQTMSGHCMNILDRWQDMERLGVDSMRLSAHSHDVLDIAQNLAGVIKAGQPYGDGPAEDQCNGYWENGSGKDLLMRR
ncbi:protease [Endozoicomonas montiporae]|uniref:Ubiquinone biosynthesis protein UbiV n=2 Tax=Endozoicomonas montiporae TaxID=1027273 RepID=A0A081N5U7_9GAMM|nr:U32 family peptidase [Endozoicomonas montiporae]AMO57274.1 protease [Endozoicomonas montiporae CL-33]KEQ13820.1 protease [Endozoicomonas montiporae]